MLMQLSYKALTKRPLLAHSRLMELLRATECQKQELQTLPYVNQWGAGHYGYKTHNSIPRLKIFLLLISQKNPTASSLIKQTKFLGPHLGP
ncbi:hypothetical protein Pcaca04_03160 [Pectobacterium carotovorum subsp. carotovorum]|nr:hypothetical protein Pcaca04_03160 [Pectobacterium carotovorum subsp. carotovorum]